MKKRVLVTGATGFIGRQCLGPLVDAGFDVHAVSRRQERDRHVRVTWHQVDLLDTTERRALVVNVSPSHLLHLAWCTEHGTFWADPANLAWTAATLDLVVAFATAGGHRLVATGSCAEYDWSDVDGPLHETASPRRPSTLYGQAKLSTQELLTAYAKVVGLSHAWAVLFFLIGPSEKPGRLVPSVVRALLDGRRAQVNAGTLVRDFLDVRDSGKALVALLDSLVEGRVNIGSGRGTTLSEIGRRIAVNVGRPDLLEVSHQPTAPGTPLTVVADVARLRSEVGFLPSYSFDDSIASCVDWSAGGEHAADEADHLSQSGLADGHETDYVKRESD